MAVKPLEITRLARQEIRHLTEYYAEFASPEVARRAESAVFAALSKIKQAPQSYREGAKAGTREYVMRSFPYTVVFRIKPQAVQILRVLHQARQYFNR